jgi:predicted nucleotidyltransferase
LKNDINDIIRKIRPVLTRYGIQSASIVGSMAYGDFTDESDIDLVVDIEKPMSLLTFSALKIELEELLHKKVDLLERSAIKLRLRQSILSKEIIVA